MTISAFLPNPVFEPESLFRQVNQKNIRPNYSAESLLGRTLGAIDIGHYKDARQRSAKANLRGTASGSTSTFRLVKQRVSYVNHII